MRQSNLRDLESVKLVLGLAAGQFQFTPLSADQIGQLGTVPMTLVDPSTLQWRSESLQAQLQSGDAWSQIIAFESSPVIERGAHLVGTGQTYNIVQSDGLAVGTYMQQRQQLAKLIGGCSAGCAAANVTITIRQSPTTTPRVQQICRHTGLPCRSCQLMHTDQRQSLLERLVIQSRLLIDNDSNAAWENTASILDQIQRAGGPALLTT